jgi:hypothetical protein
MSPFTGKLPAHLAVMFDGLTGWEIFELEELPNLDLAFLVSTHGRRDTPGPLDGLFA